MLTCFEDVVDKIWDMTAPRREKTFYDSEGQWKTRAGD